MARDDGAVAMTKDEMLDASVAYLARAGLANFSLRSCAAAIGTSHRMLGYYFGSRDEMLVAITSRAAELFRDLVVELVAGRDIATQPPTGQELDGILTRLYGESDLPGLLPLLAEATFEIARRPGVEHGDVRRYTDLVDQWRPITTAQLGLSALPPAQAEARLRLALAVMVGLAVDYLGTGDRAALIAAQREWLRLTLGV